MDDVLKRFLTAFNQIERYLKRFCKTKSHMTFYQLIEKASQRNSGVKRYAFDLREFGDLRNAVMHGYHDRKPLATPYPDTVAELELIRDHLRSPPMLGKTIKKDVYRCTAMDKVGSIAKTMFENDWSQVPVYDDRKHLRLLNADTITRWFATRIEENAGVLEEESVGEVLKYAEKGKRCVVLGEHHTVFDALTCFEEGFEQGCCLDAVVMTPMGNNSEMPTGIATIFDIPLLQKLVSGAKR